VVIENGKVAAIAEGFVPGDRVIDPVVHRRFLS
jgi:hypothetical protein